MDTMYAITPPNLKQELADSTRRKRARVFAGFARWCAAAGYAPSPPSSTALAVYVRAHAGRIAASTLASRIEMIRADHRRAGLPWPDEGPVDAALAEARELRMVSHDRGTLLEAMVTTMALEGEEARRDAAVLACLASGLRADEIVAMRGRDVQVCTESVAIAVRGDRSWLGDPVLRGDAAKAIRLWVTPIADDAYVFRCLDPDGGRLVHADVARIVLRRAGPVARPRLAVVPLPPSRARNLLEAVR